MREGIPITIGENGDHFKSHSDVVMVAEVSSECSKSPSDGVLIKKDNIEQNIQITANAYIQLNLHAMFFANGRGNFIAGMVHDYLNWLLLKIPMVLIL